VVLELWVVENRPSPLLWPMAYTTACTTVQTVMEVFSINPINKSWHGHIQRQLDIFQFTYYLFKFLKKICIQRNQEIKPEKNQMITLAIMGRSNPVWNLDQIWHECRYAWHNHVYSIWWLSFKGCKFGEGSKFSISHWLEVSVSHLEHRSHVWPCDATVVGVN